MLKKNMIPYMKNRLFTDFFDGNMLILPNTLGNLLEKLQSDEEIGAVGGRSNIYVGNQKFSEAKTILQR